MGNSNKKNNFKDNANEKTDELLKENKKLESNILVDELLDEISIRGMGNIKKDAKKTKNKNNIEKKQNLS